MTWATARATILSSSAGTRRMLTRAPSADNTASPLAAAFRAGSISIPSSPRPAHTPERTDALFSPMPPENVITSIPPSLTRKAPR